MGEFIVCSIELLLQLAVMNFSLRQIYSAY